MQMEALNLREVMVFLVAAGVVVPLINRLRISPVLGFLLVGLIIGPFGLARFTDDRAMARLCRDRRSQRGPGLSPSWASCSSCS